MLALSTPHSACQKIIYIYIIFIYIYHFLYIKNNPKIEHTTKEFPKSLQCNLKLKQILIFIDKQKKLENNLH